MPVEQNASLNSSIFVCSFNSSKFHLSCAVARLTYCWYRWDYRLLVSLLGIVELLLAVWWQALSLRKTGDSVTGSVLSAFVNICNGARLVRKWCRQKWCWQSSNYRCQFPVSSVLCPQQHLALCMEYVLLHLDILITFFVVGVGSSLVTYNFQHHLCGRVWWRAPMP
jgi:hypothetical protein